MARSVEVNGRSYRLPERPVVVVCVDGCEPDYIAQAVAGGHMPWMKRVLAQGTAVIADCVMPSFTNPNNLSIVTGAPPAVHGICGNYLYDTRRRRRGDDERPEVAACRLPCWPRLPMPAARSRWSPPRTNCANSSATSIRGVCFSAEKADQVTRAENGIEDVLSLVGLPVPSVYSAALSEFVFAAGVKLMQTQRPGRHVPVDHRLRAAQARARHRRRPTLSTP